MKSVLAAMLLLAPAAAEEWTRFRGPNGSGISADAGFPIEFGKSKNVLWRTPVRSGKSSPVLTARHVFLTASEGDRLYTQCFDRRTGRLAWERFVVRERTEVTNRLNHEAALTPVTDGSNVYAFFKDFGFVSYDAAGNLKWKTPLGPFNNTQGLGTSPILAGGMVILVADQWEQSFIAGFDLKSGEMRWKVARGETEGWATPVLHPAGSDAPSIVTFSRGLLGLHRAVDGRRAATLAGLPTAVVASPAIDGDMFYGFGYGVDAPAPFAPRLEKLDANKDGKLAPAEYGADPILNSVGKNAGDRDGVVVESEWNVFANRVLGPNCLIGVRLSNGSAREVWRHTRNFTSVVPTLLAYRDVLYVIRNGGILTTHDAATGDVIKTGRLAGALGGYSSSPVAAGGHVWLASEEGKVTVLRAGGDWETLAVNDLGEDCFATPALSGGVIYLRTGEALYAFSGNARVP